MRGRRTKVMLTAVLTGLVCLLAGVLHVLKAIDLITAGLLLVVAFPAFVLSLFHLWKAGGRAGDIPFMGY